MALISSKVALIFAALLSTLSLANQDIGLLKLQKMKTLRDGSSDGIIHFTAREYDELVIQNPRPYNMINFFTVKSGCDECTEVYKELIGVAYSYDQHEADLQVPIFFGVIYYSNQADVKAIFEQHGFRTIPFLAMSEMQTKRDEGDFYSSADLWKIKKDEAYGTQQLLDHINKRFINEVPIEQPFHVILINNLVLFGVLVVLIRIFVSIQEYLINPYLWITIAWVGYFICTSGFIYTILNNMPMFKMAQDEYGKMYVEEYFMRSNRGQYGGEGYITAFIALTVSAAFLVMIKADKLFKSDLHRRAGIGIAIFVAFVGVALYLVCYRIKTPWYSNDFWPPAEYQRGPITRDQGNNI